MTTLKNFECDSLISTTATAINLRPYQEDRMTNHILSNGDYLFGVFDGHGGDATADFASKHAPYIFRSIQKKFPSATGTDLMEKFFHRLIDKTQNFIDGCTVAFGWITDHNSKVYVGILGDSSIVLRDSNDNIWNSPKHNIRTNASDAAFIANNTHGMVYQGYIFRGLNRDFGIQLTRTIGDKMFDGILIRKPEIFSHDIDENSWILCCTDGVIDAGHPINNIDDYVTYLQNNNKATATDILTLAEDNTDNATAIVIRFA